MEEKQKGSEQKETLIVMKNGLQSMTYDGETRTLTQWADKLGLPASAIHSRLSRGLSAEQALNRDYKRVYRGAKHGKVKAPTATVAPATLAPPITSASFERQRQDECYLPPPALPAPSSDDRAVLLAIRSIIDLPVNEDIRLLAVDDLLKRAGY